MKNLLLVGSGGHGKSTVGNRLLDRNAFPTDDYTEEIKIKIGCNDEFNVIDTHGLFETEKNIDVVFDRAEDAVIGRESGTSKRKYYNSFTPPSNEAQDNDIRRTSREIKSKVRVPFDDKRTGFDAILFVIKYGIRYTKQDAKALKQIKLVFGKEIIENWGIVIFTFGENLNENENIDAYINKQPSHLKKLIDEVQNRYVLLHKDHTTENVQTLIKAKMKYIIRVNKRYTLNNFLINATASFNERFVIKYTPLKQEMYDIISKFENLIKSLENLACQREHSKYLRELLQLNISQDEVTERLILEILTPLHDEVKKAKRKLGTLQKIIKKTRTIVCCSTCCE